MPGKPYRAIHVECPQCKMRRGVRCVSANGRPTSPHAKRRQLLRERQAYDYAVSRGTAAKETTP